MRWGGGDKKNEWTASWEEVGGKHLGLGKPLLSHFLGPPALPPSVSVVPSRPGEWDRKI